MIESFAQGRHASVAPRLRTRTTCSALAAMSGVCAVCGSDENRIAFDQLFYFSQSTIGAALQLYCTPWSMDIAFRVPTTHTVLPGWLVAGSWVWQPAHTRTGTPTPRAQDSQVTHAHTPQRHRVFLTPHRSPCKRVPLILSTLLNAAPTSSDPRPLSVPRPELASVSAVLVALITHVRARPQTRRCPEDPNPIPPPTPGDELRKGKRTADG